MEAVTNKPLEAPFANVLPRVEAFVRKSCENWMDTAVDFLESIRDLEPGQMPKDVELAHALLLQTSHFLKVQLISPKPFPHRQTISRVGAVSWHLEKTWEYHHGESVAELESFLDQHFPDEPRS